MSEIHVRRQGSAATWGLPLSQVDPQEHRSEPAYAVADAWVPPHVLSVPAETCRRIRARAKSGGARHRSLTGTYHLVELDPADERAVRERAEQANAAWWGLELREWEFVVKRYAVGEEHAEHQDLYAGAARRKLGAIVQLSDPSEYTGGALTVRLGEQQVELPRELGTLAVWPGWTLHQVAPVHGGERFALAVFAYGPPLR